MRSKVSHWMMLIVCLLALLLFVTQLPAVVAFSTAATVRKIAPVSIQLDIEPYLLAQWKTDRNSVSNQFLDLIVKLQQIVKEDKIPLYFAIPRWFDTTDVSRTGKTRPLSEWIQDLANIVVMDYVNSASRAISDGATEVAYAQSLRDRKVVLALETMELPDEPTATFYGKTSAQFEEAIAQVHNHFKNWTSFDAMAIHYIDSWRQMNPNCVIPSDGPMRDLYVWDWEIPVDQTKLDSFFDYLGQQAPKNKIRKIYLESQALLTEESTRTQLKAFTERLYNTHSIQLELMTGDSDWALTENHHIPITFVTNSRDFIRNMTGSAANSAHSHITSTTATRSLMTLLSIATSLTAMLSIL